MAYIQKKTNAKGEAVYKIKVSCGYNSDGKQITRTKTYKPDSKMTAKQIGKEVNKQAVLFEQEIANNNVSLRTAKFEEVAKQWLNYIERAGDVKISSIQTYKGAQERTYKAIGHIQIGKLTKKQVQDFIYGLADGFDGGRPLATKTQKNYLTFISGVCNYAIEFLEIITKNPCTKIKCQKKEVKERQIYTLAEEVVLISRLKERNTPIYYVVYFLLLIHLGLRKGEALGIKWSDFNMENGTVYIQRQVQYRNASTGVYLSSLKTKNSYRCLQVPQEVIILLPQMKAEQEQLKKSVGDNWQENNLLFTNWCGKPKHPNEPYNWLKKFCEREDLQFKTLHSFRHSSITHLIHNGDDIAAVANMHGHDVNVMLGMYTHEIKEATVNSCNLMSQLLAKHRV